MMTHLVGAVPCLALVPAVPPASTDSEICHNALVSRPSALVAPKSNVLGMANSNTVLNTPFGLSSSSLLASANWEASLSKIKTERDEVVRVLDANTVKMQKSGLVTMAMAKTPSGYNKNDAFPDCMSKSPSSKIRKLLPKATKVGIRIVDEAGSSNSGRPREALVIISREKSEEPILVNAELVRSGFAKPSARGKDSLEKLLPGISEDLQRMQADAKERGLGLYAHCEDVETDPISLDDQFEPLDFTVETKYGDDGGKQVIVKRNDGVQEKPPNPGDTKGCSDFETYEQSLRYFETFYPYYGDVAKLDRDGDGIPCPGLPHTTDQSIYRMKVPTKMSRDKGE